MTAVNPIQRRKLYQDVVERLMLRIQSGEIRPGDHLPPERELMDVYGVGRPAVREALQALERSGIVEISHGERAKVVVPTARDLILQIASGTRHLLQSQPDMLDHLKEARLFLEIGTARMAAQKAGPQDIEALRARIEDQRAALTQTTLSDSSAPRDSSARIKSTWRSTIAASVTGEVISGSIVPARSSSLKSRIVIAHVRRANRGRVALERLLGSMSPDPLLRPV